MIGYSGGKVGVSKLLIFKFFITFQVFVPLLIAWVLMLYVHNEKKKCTLITITFSLIEMIGALFLFFL